MKEQPRLAPIALHRAFGDLAECGDLGEGKAAEEVQVHQLGKRGLELAQLIERLTESLQLRCLLHWLARGGSSLPRVISNWRPRFFARRLRA